jgi:lipopolysaccharide/colanic/teichoic acid biosynthesis glycosyltransferase
MGMDMYYARNKSLLFDIKIMLKTPMAIVGAKGSY